LGVALGSTLSECSISLLGTSGMSTVLCKDVSVSPKEADERVFLFRVPTRPNNGGLAVVTCHEVDGLHLHFL
jgi:tRNA (Thr-GGU) A37 N-methylase